MVSTETLLAFILDLVFKFLYDLSSITEIYIKTVKTYFRDLYSFTKKKKESAITILLSSH